MKLLLDTHVFLWWRADAPQLPAGARAAMLEVANEIYVSAAVAWEIVIKRALGKLDFDGSVASSVAEEGFLPLPVRLDHVDAIAGLPAHHRDPFDRLLVAQARSESMTLVSYDQAVRQYEGVPFLE